MLGTVGQMSRCFVSILGSFGQKDAVDCGFGARTSCGLDLVAANGDLEVFGALGVLNGLNTNGGDGLKPNKNETSNVNENNAPKAACNGRCWCHCGRHEGRKASHFHGMAAGW